MKKILVVFGTRPEAIKLAPVIKELEKHADKFETLVCISSQHREMLDQVLETFAIQPDIDLNVMTQSQDLFDIASNVLTGLKNVLAQHKPDIVLVQGDTSTTFVAGLASYYCKIPVAHIEAGLRTFKKFSPFPEEINRKLTSVISDYHFAPTASARDNLVTEGYQEDRIFVTGNTVIDALLMTVRDDHRFRQRGLIDFYDWEKVILVTAHRRESFGRPFEELCLALNDLAASHPKILVIYPVHLNPNVREPVYRILGNSKNVRLIEPLDYESFVQLMNKSYLIITDSGGIQEEAPSLGKPVLVMREVTERPEAVDAGTVKLVGTERKKIFQEASLLLGNKKAYLQMARAINPYGDGKASQRIVKILLKTL